MRASKFPGMDAINHQAPARQSAEIGDGRPVIRVFFKAYTHVMAAGAGKADQIRTITLQAHDAPGGQKCGSGMTGPFF